MHEVNQFLRVRSANEHNLKNIDINIPKNRLIVMTGVSGSGKSSWTGISIKMPNPQKNVLFPWLFLLFCVGT